MKECIIYNNNQELLILPFKELFILKTEGKAGQISQHGSSKRISMG